jgi:uncharacterized protein with GYD domain
MQVLRRPEAAITFNYTSTKGTIIMAMYVSLIQFTDQGIRNVKDTIKRGDAAMAEAEKMGIKIIEEFWTMGGYDIVALFEAPDDETVSAFLLKNGALGNAKSQTLRAFRKEEMEGILAKIK